MHLHAGDYTPESDCASGKEPSSASSLLHFRLSVGIRGPIVGWSASTPRERYLHTQVVTNDGAGLVASDRMSAACRREGHD